MTKAQKTVENKTGISIQATPDKVWEVLVDLDHYSDWNPLYVKARGTLAVGEQVQIKSRLPVRLLCGAPMTRNWSCRVTKILPNNSLEWFTPALVNGFLDGTHFFQLTASSDGQTTEFVQGERYEGWGMGLCSGFGTLEDARLGFAAMNRALKLEVLRRVSETELVATAADGAVIVSVQDQQAKLEEKHGEVHAEARGTTAVSAVDDEKMPVTGSKTSDAGGGVTAAAAAGATGHDATETIEVVGTRAMGKDPLHHHETSSPQRGEQGKDDDDDDDDDDKGDSQGKEGSKPGGGGHRKRRSLAERMSGLSFQSGTAAAVAGHEAVATTVQSTVDEEEEGEEEEEAEAEEEEDGEEGEEEEGEDGAKKDEHDEDGKGRQSKADEASPFQLGLDLNMGGGLDFTF